MYMVPTGVWEYIETTRNMVCDLERRVRLAKANVESMVTLMSGWSQTPLFKRKEEKKEQSLLNLEVSGRSGHNVWKKGREGEREGVREGGKEGGREGGGEGGREGGSCNSPCILIRKSLQPPCMYMYTLQYTVYVLCRLVNATYMYIYYTK